MFTKAILPVLFSTLMLLGGAMPLRAQHIIEGHVTDAKKGVVPFAVVVLQRVADSSIIITSVADSAGYYKLDAASLASVLIRTAAAGLSEKIIRVNDTGAVVQRVDVVMDKAAARLNVVTVTSSKPVFERKADRTIFNVESSASSIGNDALEVLKRAPGVRVETDGISIAGKSTVDVMINDRIVQLSGNELIEMLKSMPAENLSRIEVITTPPAKYDAAGNAGLINIVTKKQLRNGLNGQATASYNQHRYGGGGINTSFNYRQGRLNVFGTGNAFHSQSANEGHVTTYYPMQEQAQNSSQLYTNVFNRLQVGADYSITPKMVLGVLCTIGNGGWKYLTDESYTTTAYHLPARSIDSVIQTSAQTRDRGVRNVFNVNWEWKPDTSGKKVSADVDYFTRTGRAQQQFITNDFLESGTPTGIESDNKNSGKQVIDIRAAKVDVEYPTHFAKFLFGGKVSFIHNTSDNAFQYLNGLEYINDPGRSNSFDYRENTQALYLSGQQTYGKWAVQAGLRGEYTQTRGYSQTVNQTNTNDYFQLFPTAYVQYHYSDDHIFGINYSRRIERPSFWILNPFRAYSTPASYEAGNPYLQPSFAHNIELSYTLHSKYIVSVFAEHIDHYFARFSTVDTVRQSVVFSQANLGTAGSYGLSLSGDVAMAKWWEANIQLRGYAASFTSSYYSSSSPANYSKAAFTADISNNFSLNKGKTLLAEIGGQYTSSQLSDFDIQDPIGSVNAGVKVLLLKGKLVVGANLYDIFRTEWTVYRNLTNGTYQRYYADERNLHIAVTWKFGNNGIKAVRERADNEESKRVR